MSTATFKPVDEQLAYLKKGAAEIIPEPELRAALEKSLKTGTPLRVYLGVDPTAPDLHLGHTVVLRKLKHFQDMGHTAVFLIGDFSAMIGDPTGVSETRPPLTREQVDANAQTYLAQVFKILDPGKTEVRRNSDWLSKLSAQDVVRLCGRYRLARLLEREDFRKRLNEGQPISVHELLYPLLTALDAVELKSDVELGATEQKFNLLVHREIQREYGLPGQAILTMPILVGLDGQRKMSKSLGNYIGITELPADMFGKIMSIPDDLMWLYYDLLTDYSPGVLGALLRQVEAGIRHPMDVKMDLAKLIVRDFHGTEAAEKAAGNFQRIFRDRQAPTEMPEIKLRRRPDGFLVTSLPDVELQIISPSPKWPQLLKYLSLAESISDAARLIKQNGLEINGEIVNDPAAKLDTNLSASYQVRVGKKQFLRLIVE